MTQFGRQAAADVVRDGIAIEDHEVDVSVLFLDVWDFTAWAETASPTAALRRVNRLWDVVVPILLDCGGHPVSFLGDGLFAVFGAPVACADHADAAVRCALRTASAIDVAFDGSLSVGIGIDTGRVVAGSIGGAGRLEFTVMGDVVNTAARIEAATRATGDSILISDATRAALTRPRPHLLSRPAMRLRGKSGKAVLHTPISPAPVIWSEIACRGAVRPG